MAVVSGDMSVKAVVVLIAALLLFAPFLFQDVRSLEVAARICVFIVLVASYEVLIGYTGIVSFAHTMFFGFGAYDAAIALKEIGPTWGAAASSASSASSPPQAGMDRPHPRQTRRIARRCQRGCTDVPPGKTRSERRGRCVVARAGVEPATPAFSVQCSTS